MDRRFIEGVMMRAPACLTVAVRRPDGTIALREGLYRSTWSRKLWKLPGFRGVAMLVESMTMGFSALQFSAEQQMTEEELAQDEGSGRLTDRSFRLCSRLGSSSRCRSFSRA